MIGKILTISDADGKPFVQNARGHWQRQGFDISEIDIEDAVKRKNFDEYSLIAITTSNEHQDMFTNCMHLIKHRTQVPIVLFIIAAISPEFEIKTLQTGADRVLPLPMDMEQAIANCVALIRRYMNEDNGAAHHGTEAPTFLECDGLFMDIEYWKVVVEGQEVTLTPREYQLLQVLVEHKHQVLSYRQIFRHVWNDDELGFSPRLISNLISRLRSKLKVTKDTPNYIQSIRDVGYRFGAQSI